MLIIVISILTAACVTAAVYIIQSRSKAEQQKCYDAAYKMMKETCLDNAINKNRIAKNGRHKLLLYLKWKDQKKEGFVFDPEKGVRIGRDPNKNEICIREDAVSGRQCRLFLYEGNPVISDLRSANGTWIKRGMWKHAVQGTELLYTGDSIIIGDIKIKVIIFDFDMTYM